MNIQVGSIGPRNAKIVLIGEAPGDEEMWKKQPFVGSAEQQLDGQLKRVGIDRNSLYITNIVKRKLPYNDFTKMYKDKSSLVPTDELRGWWAALDAELAELNPNVIVPLGRHAMYYLTGKPSIEKWRGSILEDRFGRKVVGTYHPSAVLRKYSQRPTCLTDFRRIKNESEFSEIILPEREFIIGPHVGQVIDYLNECLKAPWVSVDIEVQWFKYISCIGLSYDPKHAISIPLIKNGYPYWSGEDFDRFQPLLKRVLAEKRLVGQNFHFDWCWLKRDGYDCNLWFDTLQAQHAAWPELPRSLAYLASVYTREPFWKDEAKEADPDAKSHTNVKDYAKYWTYNCKDAAVTGELVNPLSNEIDRVRQRPIFEQEMANIPIFVDTTLKGFAVDKELRRTLRQDTKRELVRLNRELDDRLPETFHCRTCKGTGKLRKRSATKMLAPHTSTMCPVCKQKNPEGKGSVAYGCEVCQFTGKKMVAKFVMQEVECAEYEKGKKVANTCKGTGRHINPDSPDQIKDLVFNHLKLPKQYQKHGEGTTLDRLALLKLQVKRPSETIFQPLLDYSERSQEMSMLQAELGPDGRMHTTLSCNTSSGRLSSRSSPFGHGTNLQNPKRHGRFRELYVADPGHVLVAADYEKAEAYSMGYEANDPIFIDALENCPHCKSATGQIDPGCKTCKGTGRGDIHTKNATIIFEKAWHEIVKDERQLGKRAAHGIDYCMGAPTLVDYVLKELGGSHAITQAEARKFTALYLATYTRIKGLQDFVEEEIKKCRVLWNSFGRRHEFLGRPDKKTVRRGWRGYLSRPSPTSPTRRCENAGNTLSYSEGFCCRSMTS